MVPIVAFWRFVANFVISPRMNCWNGGDYDDDRDRVHDYDCDHASGNGHDGGGYCCVECGHDCVNVHHGYFARYLCHHYHQRDYYWYVDLL